MSTFSRRALIRASGLAAGAGLFAPFIRHARAGSPPKVRVVLFVEGNGIYPRAFGSDAAKALVAASPGAPPIVPDALSFINSYRHNAPLVATGDPLHTPKGSLLPLATGGPSLVSKSAVVLGLSSTVSGGGHSSYQGGLSCSRGDMAKTPAITIDAALAAKLGTLTPFDAVRLGVAEGTTRLSYATCAFGPGRPAPITTDPIDAYRSLFATIVGGANQATNDERKKMLDFARDEVKAALATFGGSSTERAKLETYLASLEASQTTQDRLLAMKGKVAPLVPPDSTKDARYTSLDALDKLAVQCDLATTALLGGLTYVVTIVSGPGGGLGLVYKNILGKYFTGADAVMQRHPLHHGNNLVPQQNAIMDVTAAHVGMIAKMARKLDTQPEGDGTMLDHTIFVYMSDNGEAHHAQAREWPMLLVGGKKLGFHTDGRSVIYPVQGNPNNRQVSNMFNTLGHATGDTSMDAFGLEGATRLAKGPLGSEIWSPV